MTSLRGAFDPILKQRCCFFENTSVNAFIETGEHLSRGTSMNMSYLTEISVQNCITVILKST